MQIKIINQAKYMKVFLLVSTLFCSSCVSIQKLHDPSLFPDKSQEWRDGFQAGMMDGVLFSVDIPINLP
jgi:hypothetical protein